MRTKLELIISNLVHMYITALNYMQIYVCVTVC